MKRFAPCLLAAVMMLSCPFGASASSAFVMENGTRVPITAAYTFAQAMEPSAQAGALNQPNDICADSEGYLYVADTGNNRIVKFDGQGNTVRVFTNGGEKGFAGPEGVFVQPDGDLFVADTGNFRIVHLTQEDRFVEAFLKPESDLLDKDFVFQPSKVAISPTNLIYVLNKTHFMGLFSMDADNNFRGFAFDTKVGYQLFDQLLRIFGSEFQQRMTAKRLPAPASNFCVSGNQVYTCITTKGSVSGQIGRYTSVGINLMEEFDYGLSRDDFGESSLSSFVDIDVSEDGIIAVLDQKNGKVMEYSGSGDQIAIFGIKGAARGMLDFPVALCYGSGGTLYVLDQSKANIQAFSPTPFIRSVHSAVRLYEEGKYEETKEKWQEVLQYDESYTLAKIGIARSEYKNGQFRQAADAFRLADDKEGYSEAYSEMRHSFYRQYFVLIVLGVLLLIVGVYFGFKWLRKRALKFFYG